ncbi:MAG: protein-disulfide reductase DsbD domain-containing protein [Verrucomicrobiota bacterium]
MMIPFHSALISAAMCSVSLAAVRSGKAEADWISTSGTCEAGKPLQTAVRLALDEGWHTYWKNPGEGGMEISVKWELPEGWKAGELEQPVPKRFMTGGLPGFGYEGSVIFPVAFTPPAGFSGEAKLRGKISWLTCNDDSCVPGNADLELSLSAGPPAPTQDAATIAAALEKIPQPRENGAALTVEEKPKTLLLAITGIELAENSEIFPATPQVVDAAADFKFSKAGDRWTAEVPKNEYATGPAKELTLVLAGKGGTAPVSLTWKAK